MQTSFQRPVVQTWKNIENDANSYATNWNQKGTTSEPKGTSKQNALTNHDHFLFSPEEVFGSLLEPLCRVWVPFWRPLDFQEVSKVSVFLLYKKVNIK